MDRETATLVMMVVNLLSTLGGVGALWVRLEHRLTRLETAHLYDRRRVDELGEVLREARILTVRQAPGPPDTELHSARG
jgi:hypothetical protein